MIIQMGFFRLADAGSWLVEALPRAPGCSSSVQPEGRGCAKGHIGDLWVRPEEANLPPPHSPLERMRPQGHIERQRRLRNTVQLCVRRGKGVGGQKNISHRLIGSRDTGCRPALVKAGH